MKDMKPFIIEIVFGIILIGVSFFVKNDYYSTMVFSMGFGFIAASVAQIIRITYWKNIEEAVRTKRSGNTRSGMMSRPYTYACKYTTQFKCITVYGIFKRQELTDDI